jgi:hypothetical protein
MDPIFFKVSSTNLRATPLNLDVPTRVLASVTDKIRARVVAVDCWVSPSPQARLRFLDAPSPTGIGSCVVGPLSSCRIYKTLFFVFPEFAASDSKPLLSVARAAAMDRALAAVANFFCKKWTVPFMDCSSFSTVDNFSR